MKPKVYGIRNCDTMKKAFAWLEARGIAYDFHDYKKQGVPAGKLRSWAAKAGWERLANTRGPTWRKIPETQRGDLSEGKVIALLEANSSAIRRPVVEAGDALLIGFDVDEFSSKLRS